MIIKKVLLVRWTSKDGFSLNSILSNLLLIMNNSKDPRYNSMITKAIKVREITSNINTKHKITEEEILINNNNYLLL
jgi:hypothetical protein